MHSPTDLYQEIEHLYKKERYSEILELELDYLKMDVSSLDSEKLKYLAEIFALTYMQLDMQGTKLVLKSQFKAALKYEGLGGSESDILNWKLQLEEVLFLRYVKVNKYILYLILLAVLIVNLDFIPPNNAYLPTLTAIAIVWYLMNYVMNCGVKRLYLQLMRFIYS